MEIPGILRPKIWAALVLTLLLAGGSVLNAQQQSVPDTATSVDTSFLPAPIEPTLEEFDLSIGYNLKVTVRMAPVYQDSSLVSGIITYLPRNSVVGVVSEHETWYQIEFGPEEDRKRGWVISYGVERTHELEHIVTSIEDVDRWKGQKVIVIAGETAVRSFPAAGAEILVRAYRNEIFDIAGESEDYYMVQLSKAVRGWIWKGDVELYVQPKYTREEVRLMIRNSRENARRLEELQGLLVDLKERGKAVDQQLETLQALAGKMLASADTALQQRRRPSIFQFDSLKKRSSIKAGFLYQNFGSKLGLATATLRGVGFSFRCTQRVSFDLFYSSADALVRQLSSEQASLPASLAGLDTLSTAVKFWDIGLRCQIGGIAAIPILRNLDNYLYGGVGILDLTPAALHPASGQRSWGPVIGWGFSRGLFGPLELEMGLRGFFTRAEVTDVRFSGKSLLESKKVFIINRAFYGGVNWHF